MEHLNSSLRAIETSANAVATEQVSSLLAVSKDATRHKLCSEPGVKTWNAISMACLTHVFTSGEWAVGSR